MRGEEKPYEMPVASSSSPQQHYQASSPPPPVATTTSSTADNTSSTKQKPRQHSNALAIQQRLQHLSPVHPQKLKKSQNHDSTLSVQLLNAPSPSAASVSSSTGSAQSVTPPPALLQTHHALDSLLTPAASPEEDPLETWIQTV